VIIVMFPSPKREIKGSLGWEVSSAGLD